jgi:hypothetical protein
MEGPHQYTVATEADIMTRAFEKRLHRPQRPHEVKDKGVMQVSCQGQLERRTEPRWRTL